MHANGCENCHRPHAAGTKQRLLNFSGEEENCRPCHNGHVADSDVMNDFSGRRGRLEGMETGTRVATVRAFVPLGEMFGYANDLRSKTQGRASHSMEFAQYERVPPSIANEIMKHTGSSFRFA